MNLDQVTGASSPSLIVAGRWRLARSFSKRQVAILSSQKRHQIRKTVRLQDKMISKPKQEEGL
jgi:uncharacterized protein VirK/YbjX